MTRPAARICCLDLDTFFVSVERLLDPSLEGKPVVVGASKGQRGVVTACSYEVREFGVRSGMSMRDAVKLAPHAIYLPTRHGVYTPYAEQVKAVLEDFTPAVQTASIDEFFLDFSGCEGLYRLPGDADDDATIQRVVWQMRDAIAERVGLPASAGVGATRSIAKIASGRAKPAGVRMVRVGEETAFVSPLPVRKFPGIGPVMEQKLVGAGVHTLGQLIDLPPGPLRARFGGLAHSVRRRITPRRTDTLGRDRPAFREHDPTGLTMGSISNERTFGRDLRGRAALDQLRGLSERVAWRARRRGIRARTVTVKIRYADFETISRARTITPTNLDQRIFECARELLSEGWTRRSPLRLLGVALTKLERCPPQLALPFGGTEERPDVSDAVDAVRNRFGYEAIRLGSVGRGRSWLA